MKVLLTLLLFACCSLADSGVSGTILDRLGGVVPGAAVQLETPSGYRVSALSDAEGRYRFESVADGEYLLRAEAPGLAGVTEKLALTGQLAIHNITLSQLSPQRQSVMITAKTTDADLDLRNAEVFNRTLFTRDDQVFQQLNAGIDAGQHEGGGKSLEIRRFGFNLDHGGVNGGLKVLVDGVQQNQSTQGHGQGYLGALKALSPELVEEVTITNGPFSAEYGDFSGLGVVHIHQRESLPDEFTVRLQGGNLHTGRSFLAYSPELQRADAYFAYEGSYTDGPFLNPGRYRRDNLNGNYTRNLKEGEQFGLRLIAGRNNFYSSGQLPLELVSAGSLDRFGYIDPSDGGRVKLATATGYFSKALENGDTLRTDGFLSRSLFDLYSDFTYYLKDPQHGDALQQHDSRAQEGFNAQWTHAHRIGSIPSVLVTGTNFHDNEINVGLYPQHDRVPTGVTTRANANVTNGAGYVQETLSFLRGRLLLGGGVRYDEFRFAVTDRVMPSASGIEAAGKWQGKGNLAFTPWNRLPLTVHLNYGRGINSSDARAVVERPDQPRVATTDFYQAGASSNFGRFSIGADAFVIDHSHEQVYIPDDGSFEFKGPSRVVGYEVKTSATLSRHLSVAGGLTKISNGFFRGGVHRVYLDSAPHLVANAALTLSAWHGWSGSLRMRAINHYRLDGEDPSIVGSGHTLLDLGIARRIRRGVELNLSFDNLTNRRYYETQNYFESRITPDGPAIARIHGTPGYPLTAVAGLTFRLRGKSD